MHPSRHKGSIFPPGSQHHRVPPAEVAESIPRSRGTRRCRQGAQTLPCLPSKRHLKIDLALPPLLSLSVFAKQGDLHMQMSSRDGSLGFGSGAELGPGLSGEGGCLQICLAIRRSCKVQGSRRGLAHGETFVLRMGAFFLGGFNLDPANRLLFLLLCSPPQGWCWGSSSPACPGFVWVFPVPGAVFPLPARKLCQRRA